MNKSISIILPHVPKNPSGGFKVMYEYANRLNNDGYQISIFYPILTRDNNNLVNTLKGLYKYLYYIIKKIYAYKWFNLNKNINERIVFRFTKKNLKNYDFYFATAISTAIILKKLEINRNKVFYFIQGFENWGYSEKQVYQTYMFGFKNIVISNWLAKKVSITKANYNLLKNGYDFNYFKLLTPITKRNIYSISMLFHTDEKKGCKYGLKAVELVKNKYPELKVTLFGTPNRPNFLPAWIEYHCAPNKEVHNKIYNESSIYLAPSVVEGWGLTVGEAMICGNAIVCTDTDGFKEMVMNGETGLISKLEDPEDLAKNIIKLIENDELRISLAKKGNEYIQSFTWDNSYSILKDLLVNQK